MIKCHVTAMALADAGNSQARNMGRAHESVWFYQQWLTAHFDMRFSLLKIILESLGGPPPTDRSKVHSHSTRPMWNQNIQEGKPHSKSPKKQSQATK